MSLNVSTKPSWRADLLRQYLSADGVIAYPTEGVWGLGCLPSSEAAVMKLLDLKKRPVSKGLILVGSHIDQFSDLLRDIPAAQNDMLQQSWPGPITWLVPANELVPSWIRGDSRKVALRVSAHPTVREICGAVGKPLVSTSANPTGRPAAKSSLRVRRYFHGSIDLIVPGLLGNLRGPSEIRDLLTGEVIRSA